MPPSRKRLMRNNIFGFGIVVTAERGRGGYLLGEITIIQRYAKKLNQLLRGEIVLFWK